MNEYEEKQKTYGYLEDSDWIEPFIETNLYLMVSSEQGMILDKSACTEAQLAFLRQKCGGNDNFCGVCVGLRNGYAAVQLAGYVRVATAAKIEAGYKKLAAGNNGDVVVNSSGRELLVVDSTATEAGIIL